MPPRTDAHTEPEVDTVIVNYNFSIITTALLVILLFTYVRWPRLPIPRTRYFLVLLYAQIAAIVLDAQANWFDLHFLSYSVPFLYCINTLYFLLYLFRAYLFLGHTLSLLDVIGPKTRWLVTAGRCVFAALALAVLSSCFTGAFFSVDAARGFRTGPLYPLTQVWSYVLLLAGLAAILVYQKRLRDFEAVSMVIAYGILMLGYVIRRVVPHTVAMNSFFMLASVVLYIALENANLYLEQRTQAFTYLSFEKVIEDRIYKGKPYWICAAVIRNYREVRQIYGGEQTDNALTEIGRFLRRSLRRMTVFYGRSGRFVLLGRDGSSADAVRRVIRERFARPWQAKNTQVYLDLVYGEMDPSLRLTDAGNAVECVRHLLEEADADLNVAEFRLDQSMMEQINRGFSVRKALRAALETGGVEVYLQPLVDAATGRTVAAEALARIEDPELGVIPPGEFISIAEKNGSISTLGEQVFEKVCRFISEHDLDALGVRFINVNLSPIQCMDPALLTTFDAILRRWSVSTDRIHLEITEESLIEEDVLRSRMEAMVSRGFSFVLDDYGNGYANQFQMREFPFSGVKLDLRIVRAHFRRPDVLLPRMIGTFAELGLSVTAEGVESAEMAEELRGMGCTYLQGYHYARPLPREEFLRYAAEGQERAR